MLGDSQNVRLRVEAGKVREFRRAIGLPDDEAATVAPPTFPVVLEHFGPPIATLLADRGIDLDRVLHGGERIRYPGGPLRIGDELSGRMTVVQTRSRTGSSGPMTVVDVRIELSREGSQQADVIVDRTLVVVDRVHDPLAGHQSAPPRSTATTASPSTINTPA